MHNAMYAWLQVNQTGISVQKAMLDAAESCEAMVPCALNGAVSCSLGRLLCKFAAAAASLLQVHM